MKTKLLLAFAMSNHKAQATDKSAKISPTGTRWVNFGSSQGYLHLTPDPMDLRPAADAIMEMALARYKQATDEGLRFVLMMGEQHDRIADMAMQQLVLSRLIDSGEDFSLSYELDANYLGNSLRNKGLSPQQKHTLSDLDVSGDASLLSRLSEMFGGSAPYSRQNLMAFCYYNNIRTGFNDAAMTKEKISILEADWPDYSISLQKDPLIQNLSATSASGMSLRNAVMTQRSLRGDGLIVHVSGASHLIGNSADSTYATSMHRYYRDNNVKTMLVVANELRPVLSQEGQYFADQDTLYLHGYSTKQSHVPAGFGFDACLSLERKHLKKIFAKSGGETGLFDLTSARAKNFFRRELAAKVKPLLQKLDVL